MAVAQFWGIMPLVNVLTNDVTKVYFKWMSLRTVYSIFCCLSLVCYAVVTVKWIISEGVEFSRCVTVIFYTSSFLAMAAFLRLSMRWPRVIRRWQATEELMSPLLKDKCHKALKAKLAWLTITVLSLSLSE